MTESLAHAKPITPLRSAILASVLPIAAEAGIALRVRWPRSAP
jgi:hypothetical protein